MSYRIGVDIGGTFTDVVIIDLETGQFQAAKAPTDYSDPIGGILDGRRLAVDVLPEARRGAETEALHHATTLATNAILEDKLPPGALLTTKGFRDVIDIGRIQRPIEGIYDFNIDNPQPLIPRALRLEVTERIGSRGEVVMPLDEDALRETLAGLKGQGLESIAVVGLFAFVNDAHEKRIRQIVQEELPGIHVSISSEVSPEIREFERSSTTVLDALLKPILTPYLSRLASRLTEEGIARTRIMMASGGLTAPALAGEKPVTMVNSGPSAGVLAAANLGRRIGAPALVTIDMGGTSLDIGTVADGAPVQRYENKIVGYPIRMPMIDVAAVAAGGGSIAHVDQVGYVQVARESAGSKPGPACYGRGGTRPTITDADLALGRLGDDFGGAGGFRLDLEAARAALRNEIGDALEIDVAEAAAAVLRIIQARMVKAISANTLEKGLDVRDMPLLVYGGAGPTHGVELAEAMSMNRVVVPYLAGNFSAVGLLLCPLRWDVSTMVMKPAADLSSDELAETLGRLDAEARSKLEESGVAGEISTEWLAHMRYAGQSYDLPIDLQEAWTGAFDPAVMDRLVAAFHDQHEKRYAYRSEEEVVEIVQLRLSAKGPELDFPKPEGAAGPAEKLGTRPVYFTGVSDWCDAALWDRRTLPEGHVIMGPAVVEGEGSSALIPPGWRAEVDTYRNLVVTRA